MVIIDFSVEFTSSWVVKAAHTSIEPYILSLSNLDHLFSGRYPLTYFYAYQKPEIGDFSMVIAVIKSSLEEVLGHYFPFSGRIVPNAITAEPEILCNNEGVEVIEAHASIDLASLDFYDLSQSLQKNLVPFQHEIPLRLQITNYTCGGFSLSWSFDHSLADATAFYHFLRSWSEVANNKPISKYPDHLRSIFQPRSTLSYGPSLDRNFCKCTIEEFLNVPRTIDVSLKRLYYIEAADVESLQERASLDGRKRTKIEAFSAYLWKVFATVIEDSDTKCKMGWLVEGRRRISQSMSNLIGNAVSIAVGEVSVKDLKQNSLSQVANLAHEAISEVTNEEHFLDLIDWVEHHRPGLVLAKMLLGIEGPAIAVSSGRELPTTEINFGFGPPVLGTCYSTITRVGSGYMNPQPSARGDGSWVVYAMVWPELAAALESDPEHVFKPMKATHLGFKL
ncbi:hypothetical protein HHK36_026040 [Tetracentron sinense]|uniref:Uncharacterized protein n=1 Tax=Tetracentron sinense TaxID=13715 RepID=A0A834YPE7_TETSI|nr:hypothetical protein HHK36_026040 [Tetracentron sinense]